MRYQPQQLTDKQAALAMEDDTFYESLRKRDKAEEDVFEAVVVIERALNGGSDLHGLRQGLGQVHSTLLGKLANEILAEVDSRHGDGRLCSFHVTLGELAERSSCVASLRVSEVRQALI